MVVVLVVVLVVVMVVMKVAPALVMETIHCPTTYKFTLKTLAGWA